MAEVLDELPDHAGLAQDLGHGQDEVGRGRALRQLARQLEADDLRDEHRERLAEHGRLGLDPADAPAEDAEPVDHRRVRVGADERVREGDAVALLDHPRQVLEVDLVHDARPRRHDLEVAEGLLAPAEERVALAVALELELDVPREGAVRAEDVDLDGVVDHELDGNQRVDLLRVAAEVGHRVPHRGEVDDGRDAGEVLQEHPGRREGDLAVRLVRGDPARDGLDVLARPVPEHVLEQDPQRVGKARDVPLRLERVEPVDLDGAVADGEGGARCELVGHASNVSNACLPGAVPDTSQGLSPGHVRFGLRRAGAATLLPEAGEAGLRAAAVKLGQCTRARATTSDGPTLPARSTAAIETGPLTRARASVIVGLCTVTVRGPILTR